jgi:hypothetical protein
MFIGYYSSSWTRQKSAKPNAGINPRSKKDAKETGSGRWVLKKIMDLNYVTGSNGKKKNQMSMKKKTANR